MVIVKTPIYIFCLEKIVRYISQDKVSAARKFVNELDTKINKLKSNPFIHRKSNYYENDNIRDLIYKGCSIIYKVDLEKSEIVVLEIFNQNLPQLEG